jgi:hypothetical protein
LNASNATDAAGDADGDGADNRDECLAGTNPTNGVSLFRIVSVAPATGGGMEIRWSSASNRLYAVWRSTDEPEGTWTNLQTDIEATPAENVYTDAAPPAAAIFYRLQVWPE